MIVTRLLDAMTWHGKHGRRRSSNLYLWRPHRGFRLPCVPRHLGRTRVLCVPQHERPSAGAVHNSLFSSLLQCVRRRPLLRGTQWHSIQSVCVSSGSRFTFRFRSLGCRSSSRSVDTRGEKVVPLICIIIDLVYTLRPSKPSFRTRTYVLRRVPSMKS